MEQPRVQSTPETLKLVALMNQLTESKNRIPENEFKRFQPLFKKSNKNEGELLELSMEWRSRIDMYHPVTVIDNNGKTLVTLPAAFTRVDTINKADASLTNVLSSAIERADPVSTEPAKALIAIKMAMDKSADRPRLTEDIVKHKNIMDKIYEERGGLGIAKAKSVGQQLDDFE